MVQRARFCLEEQQVSLRADGAKPRRVRGGDELQGALEASFSTVFAAERPERERSLQVCLGCSGAVMGAVGEPSKAARGLLVLDRRTLSERSAVFEGVRLKEGLRPQQKQDSLHALRCARRMPRPRSG